MSTRVMTTCHAHPLDLAVKNDASAIVTNVTLGVDSSSSSSSRSSQIDERTSHVHDNINKLVNAIKYEVHLWREEFEVLKQVWLARAVLHKPAMRDSPRDFHSLQDFRDILEQYMDETTSMAKENRKIQSLALKLRKDLQAESATREEQAKSLVAAKEHIAHLEATNTKVLVQSRSERRANIALSFAFAVSLLVHVSHTRGVSSTQTHVIHARDVTFFWTFTAVMIAVLLIGSALSPAKPPPPRPLTPNETKHNALMSKSVVELRTLVDREHLGVNKQVGGRERRTKHAFVDAILEAQRQNI